MSIDLNDPDVKAAIKAAVDEATTGLIAKRDELLNENKQLKKGRTVDPEQVTKLEEQIDTLRDELSAAQKAAKTATTDAEKARKALESESGYVQKLLIDNAMTDALTQAGVKEAVHLKAAKAMLSGQAQIVVDGETRLAKIGDKPVKDFIAEWAKGDEGKFFVAAPNNSGGGSQGGQGGGAAGKTVTRTQWDGMGHPERAAFSRDGGKVVES
jgi:multidrug efflux pump subunit AcrA (membrane-fusion protein)